MKSWFEPSDDGSGDAGFVPFGAQQTEAAGPRLRLSEAEIAERESAAYERGLAAGREEPPPFDLGDLQRASATLEAAAAEFHAAQSEDADTLRRSLVELALELAERVVRARIPLDLDALMVRVNDALAALGERDAVRLRLSQDDFDVLAAGNSEAYAALAEREVEVVADASLGLGEFGLEAGATTVDGRVDAMVERLREALADWTLAVSEDGREERRDGEGDG